MRHLVLLAVLLLVVSCGDKPDPWRADAGQLLARTERLADAGDIEAAIRTLAELEERSEPSMQHRGRTALVRALIKAGRSAEAAQVLARVPWADKSAEVAGELVGLQLAITWSGLLADGRLASGMIPAVEARDSAQGEGGGPWAARGEAWLNWRALLAGGVRMVEREGGQVRMPVGAGLLALARYAHGDAPWSGTDVAVAGEPAALLAAVRLHLDEHDPELALAAAERLWEAGDAASGEAYTALRLWQLRRRLIGNKLTLWPFPAVDARIDALAGRFAEAAAAAQEALTRERDLGDIGLRQAMSEQAKPPMLKTESVVQNLTLDVDTEPVLPDESPRVWRLALDHDGLRISVTNQVAAVGTPVTVQLSSQYRGAHRVQLWRIDDNALWDRLRVAPRREDLPERPEIERELDAGKLSLTLGDLAEGRWVIAASARACPVVAISSLRVAGTALHLQAGVDGVLAWTVGRGDGRGVATPLRIAWQLERDPVRAAGAAWADAAPAWRAGFTEGFLGRPDPAFVATGGAEDLAAGRAAGAAAAVADPPFALQQEIASGADGVLRLDLPPALVGRPYTVRATVQRPTAHEAAEARWGTSAAWVMRAVCWADKPLVRPGETLRFAGLLREHDGEGFRRPDRTVAVELRVGGETVWQGRAPLDGRGMFHGAAPVPAGAATGPVVLLLDGAVHALARCDRIALPEAMLLVSCADGDSQLAGESRRLRVRAVDAAGAPLAATSIAIQVAATARDGGALPVEAPAAAVTDLAGEALISIPTAAGREASWVATLSVMRGGRHWGEHHAWSTSLFPFAVEAEPDADEVEVGGVLRVRLRLPSGAAVRLQAVRGDERLGRPWTAQGGADGTAECLLTPVVAQVGADAVLLCADLPGGGEAVRRLRLRIVAPPTSGAGDPVACLPARTAVRTGDELAVTVGTSVPGRDVLLVAGSGAIIHHARVQVAAAAATVACQVGAAWSPEVHLQALAWMPDRGFTASRRTAVRILPVDRLLRVTLAPEPAEPRPGERVRVRIAVRDWQDRPVAGAGLTLGAVDQRLYALAEDQTPDLWRFFHDHQRPWRLVDGQSLGGGSVVGLLWRSVVWRWQRDPVEAVGGRGGMFGSHCGGSRRRAIVGHRIETTLGTEADPTIAWLAGVVTDAQGEAEVVVELPRAAGTWRLTARAADASAAVLVGEVRTILRAARRLDLELGAPRTARAGDRIILPVEIANHGAEAVETTMGCAGTTMRVAVEPRSRRTVPVAWTVPRPAPGAPVRRLGGQLGRIIRIEGSLGSGTPDAVDIAADVLVVPDGLPECANLMLVADGDGAVHLPLAMPSGSLVHAELRAWPDVGARRDEELLRWRTHDDANGAMAWLLAPPGAQRRAELARRWEQLDQSPAAQVVRLTSLRLGLGGGGVNQLPDGVLGDWLRARARLAGLRLNPPVRRSGGDGPTSDQVAIAGIALAEGWSEGQRLWQAVRAQAHASDDALTLALALDAARLASDQAAQRILAGRLVGVPWSDPLAAVLAADLLPAAGPSRQVELRLAGEVVEARAGAVWSGQLDGPLAISAPPGAVIALDLRWQAPPPAFRPVPEGPALEVRVDRGDGFRPLRSGETVLSGERLLLTLRGAGWQAQLTAPTGLRPVAETGEVRISDPVGWDWRLPADAGGALAPAIAAWRESPAAGAAALQAWRTALARIEPVRRFDGRKVQPLTTADAGRIDLVSGAAVLLEARMEGELRWPPVRLQHSSEPDSQRWLDLPALQVGAGEAVAEQAPAPSAMIDALARAPTCPEELEWLLGQPLLDSGLVRVLVPGEDPQLAELLAHPACGRAGHWTEAALRRWLDGEPGFDRAGTQQPGNLAELAAWAVDSRAERRSAQEALSAPQAAPRRKPATLQAWYAAAMGRVRGAPAWEDWLWQQELDAGLLESFGYARTLDGWASFLRAECGLPVRLGPGSSGCEDAPSGERLGTRDLSGRGLLLVRERNGTLLLTGDAARSALVRLSIDWQDRPFDAALAELNERLANRGLPPVTLAPDLDAAQLPPLTLRVEAMAWRDIAGYIGKIAGIEQRGLRFERVE